MPQVFVCKWLLIMGIITQVSSRGTTVSKSPALPKQSKLCAPFLSSNKGETDGNFLFSSPGYDDKRKYPNNTDCIRVLKAPSVTKVISLDFRDNFHIEPSNGCEYDYLEIRDGPYGFSPPLEGTQASYCGKKFPLNGKKILSSGQFLWLRFHSDKTIQHVGMKAVYEFVPKSEVNVERRQARCRVPVRLAEHAKTLTEDSFPQGYLSLKSEDGGEVDCTFDIESTVTDKIFIHTTMVQFQKNKCEYSYFEAYDGFTVANRKPGLMKAQVCSGKSTTWTSSFRRVVFRVYSRTQSLFPRFKVTITPLYKKDSCFGKFACGDDFCIDSSLVCDKQINCPNSQDEVCNEMEKKKKEEPVAEQTQTAQDKDKLVPYHYIILGTIGALLCVFILICMFITIRQRRIDLRNRKRDEMLRRSSEAQRHYQQQQQSQSPHSLHRDLHTPSSLEGNRLLEFTGGTGARPAGETASLGRLNKQNGVVLMGGSGLGMKQLPSGPPHSSTLPGMNPGPSSSVFYDPRTVHSSRVGKYLSVPNPPTGPAEEDECLDSPIDPIIAHGAGGGMDHSAYSSQPRCKVHGDVYQRDGATSSQHSDHQPIIHRSDSAPSKAFFRVGSATPPPNRSGANTPTVNQHHQESPSHVEHYPPRQRDAQYYPSEYPQQPDPNIIDPSQRQQPSSSYYSNRITSSPVPAYSLHNLSGDQEDGPPCICRRHEEMAPRETHAHGMVRQTSLGTPRSLRRKVYDT